MKRLKLTTEDVFEKDGRMMKVLTNGINLSERFNDNPIMLFGHNSERILGIWTALEIQDGFISALPDFDEDEFSVDIGNKVKRGTVKSASIGIQVNNAYMEGEVMVISDSTLIEASIVGIPANKNAKTIDFSKNNIVLLSQSGGEFNIEEYTKNLDQMKKEDIKDVVVETPEVITEEVVEETKTEEVTEVKVEETKEDVIDEKVEDLAAEKIELSLQLSKSEKEILTLKGSYEGLKLSHETNLLLVETLKGEVAKLKHDKIEVILSNAVSEGKITVEAKEDFRELSESKMISILSKIAPAELSLSAAISREAKNTDKNYEWYLNNDRVGLTKLSKENISLYKQLEKEYYKKG